MRTTPVTRPSASELARLTPDSRDRYVDFLRIASIGVVVLGHWLMAVVTFRDGKFHTENILGIVDGLWILTWLLQVMPLFFFVGGFSNLVTVDGYRRKGLGYGEFVASRVQRLVRPVAVLLAIWVPLAFALDGAGVDHSVLARMTRLVLQPLWFVAVYLAVTALAPIMRDLHARYGALVPAGLATAALAVDTVRFGAGNVGFGYVNMLIVWLCAQQLGFFYADGTLTNLSRGLLAVIAGGALTALAALTTFGPYPSSMVGVGGPSNMSPPTICILVLAVFQIALLMLVRPAAQRWLRREPVWRAVVTGNGVIMTVFLWHLTAMLAVVAVLLPAGFPQPDGGTALWWATRPLWLLIAAVPLLAIVAVVGRCERPPATKLTANGAHAHWVAGIGVAVLAAGAIGLSFSNLVDLDPLRSIVPAAIGVIMVRLAITHRAISEGTAQ